VQAEKAQADIREKGWMGAGNEKDIYQKQKVIR
jgi:hypothetical protein